MKFTVEHDALVDAVGWVARTLPQRPLVPILTGMRLDAADGLTLTAFDYDSSAHASVNVETGEPGTVLVPGRLLAEIIKSLPPRQATFTADSAHVTLECGSAKFTLNRLPDEEYPALPAMPPAVGTAGADAFASAVTQVAVAAARDDTLPALTGVRVEMTGGVLTLVATDRYRLAVRELPWQPSEPGIEAAVVVSARVLVDAVKAMTGGAEVTLGLEDAGDGAGILGLEGAGRRMTTRLLGGEYPKYRSLMPSECTATAELPAAAFAEAVKRVALVAERNTPVRLAFTPSQVVLEAGAGDEAQAVETLDASFDGKDLTIAFNPHYLLDGLTAIGSGTVRMSFNGPVKPAVITDETTDGGQPHYRYVLMPIRNAG